MAQWSRVLVVVPEVLSPILATTGWFRPSIMGSDVSSVMQKYRKTEHPYKQTNKTKKINFHLFIAYVCTHTACHST